MQTTRKRRRKPASSHSLTERLPVTDAATPVANSVTIKLPAGLPPKQRECAECQACCGPTLQINTPELVLAKRDACQHLCARGCSIWGQSSLPPICLAYFCNYLVEPAALTTVERPDQVGAIVQRRNHAGTLLVEVRPGGLLGVLNNRTWRALIGRDLRDGEPLQASFVDDPYSAESLRVRWAAGRLGCELTSCDDAGTPLLVTAEPVHRETPLQSALFIAGQDYPFDAEVLVRYLGMRSEAIVAPASRAGDAPRVRFRLTRRQADLLDTLQALVRSRCD